jgi:phosphoadenosine phosphosulfate reductase
VIDLSPLDRHEKIALSFSGGKDSLAVIYLLRSHLHRMTVYHVDSGDMLPETHEIVDHVASFAPNFVRIHTDSQAWIAQYGFPTDLMPHSAHPLGQAMDEHTVKLTSRYDCCISNLMMPLWQRAIVDDYNTLLIRGTKRADMRRLPIGNADRQGPVELFYPIQEWSHAQVFDYLREVGAPVSRAYDLMNTSPDCARCTAWWSEGRAEYLRLHHPELWQDYRDRLERVAIELVGPIENLRRELKHLELR